MIYKTIRRRSGAAQVYEDGNSCGPYLKISAEVQIKNAEGYSAFAVHTELCLFLKCVSEFAENIHQRKLITWRCKK